MSTIIGSSFRNDKCVEFNNGVSNEYAIVTGPSFGSDTSGAFAFWYTPRTVLGSNGTKAIISFAASSGDQALVIEQRRNASGGSAPKIGALSRVSNGAAFSGTVGGTTLVAGTRYHVVVQSSGSAWTIYINGSAETLTNWGTGAGSNPGRWMGHIGGSNHSLTIGTRMTNGTPDFYSDMKLDEIHYFNAALTSDEVTEIYKGGTPMNPHKLSDALQAKLVTWIRCGDSRDTGSTMYDEWGSNDLTLVNMDASNYKDV